MRSMIWPFSALTLLFGLFVGLAIGADGPFKVRDEGKFFNEETLRTADAKIAAIHRDFGENVLVETYEKVPAEYKNNEDPLRDWSRDRVKALEFTGIYLLATQKPRHLFVRDEKAPGFTSSDTDDVRTIVLAKFKEKDYNKGLLDGLKVIHTALEKHHGRHTQTEGEAHGSASLASLLGGSLCGLVCIGLVVVLGVWIVFALVRTLMGGGQPPQGYTSGYGGPGGGGPGGGGGFPGGGGYPPPGYGGGGGGGGFFSSFLGSMFGAGAGNWMYDSFFRSGTHPGSSLGAMSSPTSSTSTPSTPADNRTDYGTGGSFDSGDQDQGAGGSFDEDGGASGSFDDDGGGGGSFDDDGGGAGGDFGDDGGGDSGGGGDDGGGDF
jgi:TPM domain